MRPRNASRWVPGRLHVVVMLASALGMTVPGVLAGMPDEGRHQARWQQIRTGVFFDREVAHGDGVIAISAPVLAKDPARVPVTVTTLLGQNDERSVKSITLLVDQNPTPLAAVFHFGPLSGATTIRTRVRINEFSYVRAVAETSDGALYMARAFVKASGGCDVPPLKDHEHIASTLGNMRLYFPGGARLGESSVANLKISHPNYNGMQVSNTAGVYIPARFVKEIRIRYRDELVLRVEAHLTLSADPDIRFSYVPDAPGEMTVEVIDSDDARFRQRWGLDLLSASD